MILTIDGKKISSQEGESILDVAKRANIAIPTLCYKPWTEAHGGCRLCSVEITRDSWDGWKKVVTSCNHPAQDGLIVYTNTERILKLRKTLLDLLLARCPQTPEVQKMAKEYGIETTSYKERENPDDCILCGLCVKACEAIGANAISTVLRGIEKKIDTPYSQPNDACIGCASCAEVCPTHHIQYQEKEGIRHIWKQDFPLLKCSQCGRTIITKAQRDHFMEKSHLSARYFEKCELCHKKETAEQFYKLR
ncbi:MAG: (2Fe-2S)-binding protein [Candidatus Brocadiae bacterium]|nr:(2Fe-2S)-binding protein [Candidatus Brocadiia bacterium]